MLLQGRRVDHVERDRAIVRLTTQDSAKALTDILPALEAGRLSPAHLLVRDPSLDDVFLALTGSSGTGSSGTGLAEDGGADRGRGAA